VVVTEAEWPTCAKPEQMLGLLPIDTSERKLRLFACACCYRQWQVVSDDRGRAVVEDVERLVDKGVSRQEFDELRAAFEVLTEDVYGSSDEVDSAGTDEVDSAGTAVWHTVLTCRDSGGFALQESLAVASCAATAEAYAKRRLSASADWDSDIDAAYSIQANLLRDIFGNPFRPVIVNPSLLTSTVKSVAQAIYAEAAFDRMPILADALEDAGCTNADILEHCRQPGVHTRGCWVVDLVLGKE
jgi:hypothetical protein